MEGEREVMLLLKRAVNAAEAAAKEEEGGGSNVNESSCIELLKSLKDFPITVDVLLSTQIDKRVRHLKKHRRQKIRLMTVWLLEIWSNKIKADRSSSSSSRNREGKGISFQETKQSQLQDQSSSGNKKRKLDQTCGGALFPETKRRNRLLAQEDNYDEKVFSCFKKPPQELQRPASRVSKESNKNTDGLRNKVREILLEAFSRVADEVPYMEDEKIAERVKGCDPVGVADTVESVMFKKMGPYNGAKKLKYRSIIFNVKDPKNPDFRRKILVGDIKPEMLVTLSSEEMASNWRQCQNYLIKRKAFHGSIKKPVDDHQDSVAKSDGDEAIRIESLW
ncbi:hypothetical protein Dsin_007208 [Dipteronia sinensis]|uniref:TFIIS N-terminal domain-containing protein n=1 Tax=Dipteronia sinensis TaxID=43782 RepID=A0AAE0EGC1_9ROSI|nr:hypothetical protein Dsin_007208 [Dipteronia sinensis]